MKRKLFMGVALAVLLVALAARSGILRNTAEAQGRGGAQAPRLEVDPFWPKPLPNGWILGSVTGVAVDAQDNVWLVHRGAPSLTARTENGLGTDPPTAEKCCAPAPLVLKFDSAGNLVANWPGPGEGYQWPRTPQGVTVDSKGNVWIAGSAPEVRPQPPRGGAPGAPGVPPAGARGAAPVQPQPADAQVLKFSGAGKFLLQIGAPGKIEGADSKTTLNMPSSVEFDAAANEVYVADTGNRRVVVFDADSGAYKRHWGAYGGAPDTSNLGPYDPSVESAKQFRSVSCVRIAKDGAVYVCDRQNNRIQVFQKDGKFVKETVVSKTTLGDGAVWDVAFSNDPQQRFMYVADGHDKKVFVLLRESLQIVTSFGRGGRYPGHFYGVGSVKVDSKGNVFTGETYEGKRVQKFVNKGMGPVGGPNR